MTNEWLTPLQSSFLERFFAVDTAQAFFLTGGTALAAFYLHHRVSVDLDLFTLDDLALSEAELVVPQIARELDCDIGRARRTENYLQFLFEAKDGEPLQVEFVRDFGPQFGEHLHVGNINVDSIANIGANKLTAILGRTEVKDFVDLYFMLQAGHDFDELLTMAQQKDIGMQPFFLAGSLLQVRNFSQLPATTPPLTMTELERAIVELAKRLIDRSRPAT